MFRSNKKNKPAKRTNENAGADWMKQMGITIPDFDDPNFGAGDDDDGDNVDDLEAELESIEHGAGGPTKKRPKANQKKSGAPTQDLQSFHQDVNKLLGDIDRPINDDDLSDVDESELLEELQEITGEIEDERVETKPVQSTPSVGIVLELEARLAMYKKAVETAKAAGDTSKARRYDRQLKFIQELLQTARAGKPINESEIPPVLGAATVAAPSVQPTHIPTEVPVQTASPSPPPQRPTPSLPVVDEPVVLKAPTDSTSSEGDIARLKSLALQANAEGNRDKAIDYMRQLKNLQGGATSVSAPPSQPPPASAQVETHTNMPEDENSAAVAVPLIAPQPRTVMEALQQRHEEFSKRHKEAVSKGESSKARRMDRLTKQYEEAIEATRKKQPYNYEELADLPGFGEIPFPKAKPQPPPVATTAPAAPVKTSQSTTQVRPPQPQIQRPMPTNGSLPQLGTKSLIDQQTESIRLKQEQLKNLALEAHRNGDTETAKRYLIESKMVASAGPALSSDLNQESDSVADGFDTIRDDDLTKELSQSTPDIIYRRLQEDLLRQMQLCAQNQQIYAHMEGANNLIQAKEFKNLELRCARDLERLKQALQRGLKPPIFHYEKRQMNIIQVNNDLTDNDLEVNVLRGINLHVPTGYSPTALETYVIIEFPYPPETPQTARTRNVTGSANAEYPGSLHKFQIKRNDTKFKRLMSRKELKLTIFHRAGFLRSDRQLGVAFVKLGGLDQSATIHESSDIYENDHKKKPQGKLEVKIRIKEAFGATKSSELLLQHWLVIDRFDETSANNIPATTNRLSKGDSSTTLEKQTSSICTCL